MKKKDYNKVLAKKKKIGQEIERIKRIRIYPTRKINNRLKRYNAPPINNVVSLSDLLKRPQVNFNMLKDLENKNMMLRDDEVKQIEIEVKYKGFIDRQRREIENFKRIEGIKVPSEFKFDNIPGLSKEIIEKLSNARPLNLGQASRISGVTPVAISILMVYLKKWKNEHYKKN